MPTSLPQKQTSFISLFVAACVLVPTVYGIVAYDVIEHEKLILAASKSPIPSVMPVVDFLR